MQSYLSLDEPTLQPGALAALGLTDEKRRWARTHPHGVEYYAYTARGTPHHPNEDAWWVAVDDDGTHHFAIFDEISQKRGVASGAALGIVARALAAHPGSPEERLAHANDCLWRALQTAPARNDLSAPRAGVCAAVVELRPNGRLRWAAVGDCTIAIDRRPRTWRGWLGTRATDREVLHGRCTDSVRLASALGCAHVNCIDAGTTRLRDGELLWLGSDGAQLSRTEVSRVAKVGANCGLACLLESQLADARLSQRYSDDSSLVAIRGASQTTPSSRKILP